MKNKKCAPNCDDQLPVVATVGRGPQGNSSYVAVGEPDTCEETYIKGWSVDEVTGETIAESEWITKNINGGELSYQYNLRPYTNPRTFTITFVYRRPGRCEWSWTTPAIPYIWTVENEDGTVSEKPEHIVGTGVATLFVKTMHDAKWNERLNYPIDHNTGEQYPREAFNAPEPDGPWASTLTFGFGGDINVPDFNDIAKIIGIKIGDLYEILKGNEVEIHGINAVNLIHYIDQCDKRDLDHIHADLGFNTTGHDVDAFDGYATVKAYIDAKDAELKQKIDDLTSVVNNMKTGIGNLIYGVTIDEKGNISLPEGVKIPSGNINVFSGDTTAYIRTRDGEVNNDIKAV